MKRNTIAGEKIAGLADDAQASLAASADVDETKVMEGRKRLAAALDRGKEAWGQAQEYAIAKAKATDELIRDYPYHSMGIAFGVGVLLGILLARRGR